MTPAPSLATPIAIGHLQLRHRMTMGPMGDRMWSDTGAPAPGLHEYYLARVRGGVSLVTLGASEFHPAYENGTKPCFSNDDNLPALRAFTEAIHAAGVPVLVQLQHGGPSAKPSVSPSAVPSLSTLKSGMIASRALRLEEVEEMRDRCIEGAVRARNAGFDGIELAGQAGYLLGQFLSPRTNRREDSYGGSAAHRARLALEIIEGIRKRCGSDFAIGYAICADDFRPDGAGPEICVPFAQHMQEAGLDFLDVRVGSHESFATSPKASAHNRFQSRAGIWNYAAQFKQVLEIPVLCSTHGNYDPARWEEAVRDGEADVIQLAKPLLADPELPNKVLAGDAGQVRPCVLCMQCLDPVRFFDPTQKRIFCAVNPVSGVEWKTPTAKAAHSRNVLVVGAGPGGLETARVAAERGHRVTVVEQDIETGGGLRVIARGEGGDVYLKLRDWLEAACSRAGVQFQRGTPATVASIIAAAPDAVVLACGVRRDRAPAIKGIDRQHVMGVDAALAGNERLGDHVVVLGGGHASVLVAGAIAAAKRAGEVTIVETQGESQLGAGLAHLERAYAAMAYLPGHGVKAMVGSRVEEIREREVLVADRRDGSRRKFKADCVVFTEPGSPDRDLPQALRAAGLEVHVVGDAADPRNVAEAIHDGARVARAL